MQFMVQFNLLPMGGTQGSNLQLLMSVCYMILNEALGECMVRYLVILYCCEGGNKSLSFIKCVKFLD